MYWLHNSFIYPAYNRSVMLSHISNISHPSSSLLSLQRPKQSPLSHSHSLFFSLFQLHLIHVIFSFLMPLFFLQLPFPRHHRTFHPPPAPPPSFPPPCSSSPSSFTWGTPGSRRRWSISILPLGFLSPVWGRPGLPSPSGSERHYWLPRVSHPGRQQTLKSPASRCASGSPGWGRRGETVYRNKKGKEGRKY